MNTPKSDTSTAQEDPSSTVQDQEGSLNEEDKEIINSPEEARSKETEKSMVVESNVQNENETKSSSNSDEPPKKKKVANESSLEDAQSIVQDSEVPEKLEDPKPDVPENPEPEVPENSEPEVPNQIETSDTEVPKNVQEEPVLVEQAEEAINAVPVVSVSSGSIQDDEKDLHQVKWISWNKAITPVVTQNVNGPCPLLSIMNVLLLRGKVNLPAECQVISSQLLLERLADTVLESVPKEMESSQRLDYEANVQDALALLPKLQTGLDVNVKFHGVDKFEYTNSMIVFDLLNVPLYHGWIMEDTDSRFDNVRQLGYNQLVEKIITDKDSKDENLVQQSILCHQFLEESASQLTYTGLYELNSKMKDGELAVFFRNNHFSTLYKQSGKLFNLVTDQGFLKEPRVIWETLSAIDGDGYFVDENFERAPPKSEQKTSNSAGIVKEQLTAAITAVKAGFTTAVKPEDSDDSFLTTEQQIDQDHLLAMSLAEEPDTPRTSDPGQTQQETPDQGQKKLEQSKKNNQSMVEDPSAFCTDEELAKQLQEEENRLAAEAIAQQQEAEAAEAAAQQEQLAATGRPQQQSEQRRSATASRNSHHADQRSRVNSGGNNSRNCIIL